MRRSERQREAQAFLSACRGQEQRIRALERMKERAYERETSATAHASADGVRGGGPGRRGERFAALSAELDEQLDAQRDMRAERLAAIGQIGDNSMAALLIDRYLNGASWPETAAELHYSVSYVRNELHSRALDALAEVLEKDHAKSCSDL